MRTLLALFVFLASIGAATAQTRITGVVKDQSGAVVSGASVMVVGASGVEAQTVTGPDGSFSVEAPSGGQARLVVRAGGFAENSQQIGRASCRERV
jgi:hypothetical protein